MERCSSIHPSSPFFCLLVIIVAICPGHCDQSEQEWEELSELQVEAFSVHLSVTPQPTPTSLWAVDWGPTQAMEDETLTQQQQHLLPGQDTEPWKVSEDGTWTAGYLQSGPGTTSTTQTGHQQQLPSLKAKDVAAAVDDAKMETDVEEVDPQFYVTVTISSVLILAAVIITAILCYDPSCSRNPAPLSRGAGVGGSPPLSLAIPRPLAQEDSRQTLHSTPSFGNKDRIPVASL